MLPQEHLHKEQTIYLEMCYAVHMYHSRLSYCAKDQTSRGQAKVTKLL